MVRGPRMVWWLAAGLLVGCSASEDGGSQIEASCTHVIGYSQVAEWYVQAGRFEMLVDDAAWQLRWNGGAGVDRWQDAAYEGWARDIESPCAVGSDAPERVLLSISGPYGDDEAGWADAISATVDQIRQQHSSVQQIVLQPVVGGPDHQDCPTSDGSGRVRASWQHAHIDNAIDTVVGGDVVRGFSPEVESCDGYEDNLGHLSDQGAIDAAEAIGSYYQSW